MVKKEQTMSDALRSQTVCNTEGLQGFPVKIDSRDFVSATDEQAFQFRPQFQAGSVWSYDAAKGEFDDGAYGQSSFYIQGKHYRIVSVRVVNRGTHRQSNGGGYVPEFQVWGENILNGDLSVMCIPIVRGSTTNEGMFFRGMCVGETTVDLGAVFPQGEGVNMYYYVSCNPYVLVDKKYTPIRVGSSNVFVLLFEKEIGVGADVFDRYVSNNVRANGLPIKLVPDNAIYNDLMETDVGKTVKMTKTVDMSAEQKKKKIFRKKGFVIPGAKKSTAGVKVLEVSEESLVDGTYKTDIENSEDIDTYAARKQADAKASAVEIPIVEPIITPGKIAAIIGGILGLIVLLLIGMGIYYYGKRLVNPLASSDVSTIGVSPLVTNIGRVSGPEIKPSM
jgi:hypothetical protein